MSAMDNQTSGYNQMEVQEVRNIHINSRYEVEFERSAVKGVIGYKVRARGDEFETTLNDAIRLMKKAEEATPIEEK